MYLNSACTHPPVESSLAFFQPFLVRLEVMKLNFEPSLLSFLSSGSFHPFLYKATIPALAQQFKWPSSSQWTWSRLLRSLSDSSISYCYYFLALMRGTWVEAHSKPKPVWWLQMGFRQFLLEHRVWRFRKEQYRLLFTLHRRIGAALSMATIVSFEIPFTALLLIFNRI